MSVCPNCGCNLKIQVSRGLATNKRKKKNPNEPMDIDKFIEGCKASSRRDLQIVGDYAETLRDMKLMNGEFTVRGQWDQFVKRNIRVAGELSCHPEESISKAMTEVEGSLRKNGGYLDKFSLETVHKFVVK